MFLFWALGPFVTSFELGPQTLSFYFYLFFESLSHLVLVILFRICFVSNCYLFVKVMFVLFKLIVFSYFDVVHI